MYNYVRLVLFILLSFCISLPSFAEEIFFKLDNQEIYSINDNTLAAHVDENGLLSVKLKRKGTFGIGTGTKEDPIDLEVSGWYFGRYVLMLLNTSKVAFPTQADAENTLNVCEQLGLPRAVNYVEEYIRTNFNVSPPWEDSCLSNASLKYKGCTPD
jgi:hypothetical protein